MTSKQIDAEVTTLIAKLPAVPQPWSVGDLCNRLAVQRDRELLLHSLHIPALPFGLWYDDGQRDHIIYRTGISGYHRDHTILHEICHMLAKHKAEEFALGEYGNSCDDFLVRLISRAMRNQHAGVQEELAETFASKMLKLSKQTLSAPVGDFERRAAVMFGVV